MPSGASRLNPPPRPGTTSMTSWVCFPRPGTAAPRSTPAPRRADVEHAEQHVAVTDDEVPARVAHRRRPVAAAAGLVEHHRAMPVLQSRQQLGGGGGDDRTRWCARAHQKKPCAFSRVGHHQVLGLLVVVEHHLVVLPADAGLLVAAERRVRGIDVVAVDPHPAGLDVAAGPVGGVAVAAPHPGAQAVEGVVGDRDRVVVIGERRHRHHRSEDLLLEDPHLVVAGEDGRLHVVAAGEVAAQLGALPAGDDLGALVPCRSRCRTTPFPAGRWTPASRPSSRCPADRPAGPPWCGWPPAPGTRRRCRPGPGCATGRCTPRPG